MPAAEAQEHLLGSLSQPTMGRDSSERGQCGAKATAAVCMWHLLNENQAPKLRTCSLDPCVGSLLLESHLLPFDAYCPVTSELLISALISQSHGDIPFSVTKPCFLARPVQPGPTDTTALHTENE